MNDKELLSRVHSLAQDVSEVQFMCNKYSTSNANISMIVADMSVFLHDCFKILAGLRADLEKEIAQ